MNDTINIYIDEYPGDEEWKDFVSVYNVLPAGDASEEIKSILAKKVRDVEHWMDLNLGGLGGASANEVLELGEDGIKALRVAVMRMPA